jgi:hypothetical protein
MKHKSVVAIGVSAAMVALLVGIALAAENRYTLKVPNGLSFSEFRGYEDWQAITVSQADSRHVLRLILGNSIAIKAYRAGIPGNGKPFPDGTKIAKILWEQKTITEKPFSVDKPDSVADTLKELEFREKDTERFPDTHGWGYAEFDYDAASDQFRPVGNDAKCGAECHTIAAAKDHTFTVYPKR